MHEQINYSHAAFNKPIKELTSEVGPNFLSCVDIGRAVQVRIIGREEGDDAYELKFRSTRLSLMIRS